MRCITQAIRIHHFGGLDSLVAEREGGFATRRQSWSVFHFLLRHPQPRHRSFLHFRSHSSPQKRAGGPAEAVRAAAIDGHEPESGPARRVGHERAELESRPEIVARIQHLGDDDGVARTLADRQVTDAKRGLQAELGFLPIQQARGIRQVGLRVSSRCLRTSGMYVVSSGIESTIDRNSCATNVGRVLSR